MIDFLNAVQIGGISRVGNSVVGLSFGRVFGFLIVVWMGREAQQILARY